MISIKLRTVELRLLLMKNLIKHLGFWLLILICFIPSCKKDKTNENSYLITYRIIPLHNSITKITYNDNIGEPVVITDYTQFHNGERQITVSTKPFIAKVSTEINNQTANTLYYDLLIKVGDINAIVVACSADPMTISTCVAEYTVPN